jgi:hypothetical protein
MLPVAAAAPKPSDNRAQKEGDADLLALHRKERRAHFDHNLKFLLTHVAPQLLDVRDGRVNRMSRDDVRDTFVEYLKNAQFSAWQIRSRLSWLSRCLPPLPQRSRRPDPNGLFEAQ